ncbi:MAG: glycosyltransferase [Bacteroidales bacterium]|nr:glycosyltransferase [Bacteroidales bacterium]
MENKIKIAFLISTLDVGGAERQLVNSVNGLDTDKFIPKIFVLKNRSKILDQLNSNIDVEFLNVTSYFNFFQITKILHRIKKFNPDILHSVMYASNMIARLYKLKDNNCKIINHIHGLGTWIKIRHILLDRILLPLVDLIIVVSEESKSLRLSRELYPKNKVKVIYNSIDTSKYIGIKRITDKTDEIIFGSAARLIKLKQIDKILIIIKLLKEKGLKVKYYVAGDGPEFEYLVKYSKDLNLENEVKFYGNICSMESFYSSIDVLILFSKTEDMPLSIVEAFAAGLFVIAPDIGGISELLCNRDGYLIDPNSSIENISEKILQLSKIIDFKKVSIKNKETAINYFDNKIHNKILQSTYFYLLNA